MLSLSTPLSSLYGVGPIKLKALKKLGLKKISDLIFYYPFRYEDLSKIVPISHLSPHQNVTILGKIQSIKNTRTPRKQMILTHARIEDTTGTINAVWFNQPYLKDSLREGQNVYLAGRIESGLPPYTIKNPEYEPYKKSPVHTARIVPIYNVKSGITPKWLRYLVSFVLPLIKKIPDYLPTQIKEEYNLLALSQALLEIHFPTDWNRMKRARERLAFDEFFILQLSALKIKAKIKALKALQISLDIPLAQKFTRSLPFKLTDDQRKVAWEILKDLEKDRPMNRLLEGDVGSGKTVVAALALLQVAQAGYQGVLMAPTEILAKQHHREISKLLHPFKVSVGILTRTQKAKPRAKIIVGTHALIQGKTTFPKLGLIIVDEQHRFGVKQRANLKNKNTKWTPHFLSMTATPIPRSLALTIYGDLDISIIKKMPPGRKNIITKVIPPSQKREAYKFIQKIIEKGEQAYVICPLIEKSDKLGVAAAIKEYKKLKEKVFPQFEIGLLHGKLKTQEKDKAMHLFKKGEIQVLVSTAVVEVGIDVPKATMMMIEGADRFGLASLHQFRGRVRRSKKQAYCFLFTESKSPKTLKRLAALVSSRDGFELSEHDLRFRGPGEIYGTRQSGYLDLKLGSLLDINLIKKAREGAQAILEEDIDLKKYPKLKIKIENKIKQISLE